MPSKYRNEPVIRGSERFASKREFNRWCELQMLERSGIISDLKRQVPFALNVNRMLICTYIADAVYTSQDGKTVIEDSKGLRSGAAYQIFKLKAKLMLAIHGIRVLEI